MVLNDQTKVILYPVNVHKDKRNYIVENVATGDFYEMTQVCIEAITMIEEGLGLGNIEKYLKEKYPEENVDMIGFIQDLLELGVVNSVDGLDIPQKKKDREDSNQSNYIPSKVGKIFFNKYSSMFYLVTFIASIVIFIWKPELFPTYQDIFMFDLMMYNIIIFLSITFLLVVIHEIGHVLAIRAVDLTTKIELSHRLFFIVLETDMSRIWSLPSGQRYRLYLAGVYFGALILLIGLVAQLEFSSNGNIVGIAKMIVLSTFIRIIYQCCVYMKTDFYYVLENNSGCYNLMENGQIFLKRWLPFIPAVKTSQTFEGEEKLVRPYAVFYLIGIVLTILVLVFYNIPLIIHAGILVMPRFLEPITSILFWDATVFFLQFVITLGLLSYSWTKKYRTENE